MSLMPKISVKKPSRSNVDLGNIWRSSIAPGLLYPCLVRAVQSGDVVTESFATLLKTFPLRAPLMGSFKLQIDSYYFPIRFYNSQLHDDRTGFDPSSIMFPSCQITRQDPETPIENFQSRGVHPSSLMHYLGCGTVPCAWPATATAFIARKVNAIPLLGYVDIFRSFYAHTQEDSAYVVSYTSLDSALRSFPLSEIDDMRRWILQQPGDVPFDLITKASTRGPYDSLNNSRVALGGLLCRTYLPDRFNVWVNTSEYEDTLSSALVMVNDDAFDLDQLRYASALNKMLQKTLISGGRYSDWNYVQFGHSIRRLVEVPTFISSHSSELHFEDVVQTSDTGGDDGQPLGTLGGRGVAGSDRNRFRFMVPEHGYIMMIVSLIPRVDYYQGTRHYMNHRSLADIHIPTLDGIGFQDLLSDELSSEATIVDAFTGLPTFTAIGKQPAWTEWMTDVNELHGEFAEEDKLMYWTLARRYVTDVNFNISNASVYINPMDYNYAFADASLTAENFQLQIVHNFRVKRAISKAVMPHL